MIALMQKNRRQLRKEGLDLETIGFTVYEVRKKPNTFKPQTPSVTLFCMKQEATRFIIYIEVFPGSDVVESEANHRTSVSRPLGLDSTLVLTIYIPLDQLKWTDFKWKTQSQKWCNRMHFINTRSLYFYTCCKHILVIKIYIFKVLKRMV